MTPLASRIMQWTPRLFGVVTVAAFCLCVLNDSLKNGFISACGQPYRFAGMALGVLIALSAAWHRPALGGGVFIFMGSSLVLFSALYAIEQPSWLASGVVILNGMLFLADWGYHRSNGISA